MKIIKAKCKQEDTEDKTLPTHAYVVGYVDDEFCQDIVIAQKQADVFDYYWDPVSYTHLTLPTKA